LTHSGNVLVQKSQLGGGSPIIRGFEANKVLIVVDGVRMNNAIFRNWSLTQNVITMDNSILEKTEILFGPASVMYGQRCIGRCDETSQLKNPVFAAAGQKNIFNGMQSLYVMPLPTMKKRVMWILIWQ
jgi:hemoglobin/transferrin/lactoferrin receptor protein